MPPCEVWGMSFISSAWYPAMGLRPCFCLPNILKMRGVLFANAQDGWIGDRRGCAWWGELEKIIVGVTASGNRQGGFLVIGFTRAWLGLCRENLVKSPLWQKTSNSIAVSPLGLARASGSWLLLQDRSPRPQWGGTHSLARPFGICWLFADMGTAELRSCLWLFVSPLLGKQDFDVWGFCELTRLC